MAQDIKLIDIIQEHLQAQGFHVSRGRESLPYDVLFARLSPDVKNTRDLWRFEIKDRFITINPGDALTILKVDGEKQDKEVLDMADPESIKNLDQLLEAIKLTSKRSG